jgi:DNA-binding IclR family transcriptional regulator
MPVYNIRALERGLDVLFCFGRQPAELGVTDISVLLGLNKATVSRLLATLATKGLVAENPATRKYFLTYMLHDLVGRQLERLDLRAVALPHMRRLRDLTEETVAIYAPLGAERACIEQLESEHEVRRAASIGRARPLSTGTTGRVLLAWRSSAEIDQALKAGPLASTTGTSEADRERFLTELADVRERGYCLGVDQTIVGVSGIAAPIRDHSGRTVAALSVSGPSTRWTRERMEQFAPAVIEVARQISAELGHGNGAETPVALPARSGGRRRARVQPGGETGQP